MVIHIPSLGNQLWKQGYTLVNITLFCKDYGCNIFHSFPKLGMMDLFKMTLMRHTLFISDLHLDEHHPNTVALFQNFINTRARQADALYILGDFFEMWLGDDDLTPFHRRILSMLQSLTRHGIPLYFLRGNRDFLIGQKFADLAGMKLVPEIHTIALYGTHVVLTHGDHLCLRDTQHQRFRKLSHNRFIQQLWLSLPLTWRRKIGNRLRQASRKHLNPTDTTIMDVAPEAVRELLSATRCHSLIHGHTHQPKIEPISHLNHSAERIVLGAWEERGCALVWQENGNRELIYFD
jgi:UDP-2,3-diacylglucosamine hydrolase